MDSVTQFVLGAGIGAAVLGRRVGVRRAAVAGGLLATLPDLDVFWPYANDVDRFVQHRGATHSLIMHSVVTPLLGETLFRLFKRLRLDGHDITRLPVYLAVFLCLTTHALLDALTVYGTQLFWPIWREPQGLGSIFVIDPAYTLPLLIVTFWAFFQRDWTARYRSALTVAFVLSTAYLGWSVLAQRIVEARADALLAARGITPTQRLATPTPFNTLFWRVIAMDGARYISVYVPLLGDEGTLTAYAHPRFVDSSACGRENGRVVQLAAFTRGYFQIHRNGDVLVFADLRMGLSPFYVFQYLIADKSTGVPIEPRRIRSQRRAAGDMDWLWAGIKGIPNSRPAEAAARLDLSTLTQVAAADRKTVNC